MTPPLRLLLVEDSEDDAILVSHQISRHDTPVEIDRVESLEALVAALDNGTAWDAVISDYNLPGFSGLDALAVVRQHSADLPFILVSATIGEDVAVDAMRAGANDYVMKNRAARLLPALQRELRDAKVRRDKRLADARLNYLAYFDSVTGLANRTLLAERLEPMLDAAGRHKVAVAVVDLDRFRALNESLGRQAGDALLREVGARLAAQAGAHNVARIGAGRFAVLLDAIDDEERVAGRLEAILGPCFAEPYRIESRTLSINAKSGIAIHPGDGDGATALLRHAESAASHAKESGESCLFYAQQMSARVAARLDIEHRVREALANDEFLLHYQPKVATRTGTLVGFEALIRWQSPELGLVSPARFVPVLEDMDLIAEAGAWTLRRAARDLRAWREAGLDAPHVAVNISARHLLRRDFVESVQASIGGEPGIDIEVTEGVLIEDMQGSIAKLSALRGLGLGIAIDDFGTGYSSLAYLAQLPAHALKIDGSFIVAMLGEANARTIVATIVTLAHSLGLRAIAEGVESEAQREALAALGCDEIQGFLCGRPAPAGEAAGLIPPRA